MGLIDPITGVTTVQGVTQPDTSSMGGASAVPASVSAGNAGAGSVMYPGATPASPSPSPEVAAHLGSSQGSMLYGQNAPPQGEPAVSGVQIPHSNVEQTPASGYHQPPPQQVPESQVQGVQFQQPYAQQPLYGLDPWQAQMEIYALQQAVDQYENYFRQYGEIDRILRSDPSKMQRVMEVIRGGGTPEQVQAAAAEEAAKPPSPEAQAAGTAPPVNFARTPEYQALQREIQSLRQETAAARHQAEVLRYRNQMDDMQARYGPAFDRRAVAAHAMRIGTDDLEQAFASLIGQTVISEGMKRRQQAWAQARQPQYAPPAAPGPNVIPHPAMVAQQAPAPAAPPGVRVEPPGARAGVAPAAPEPAPQRSRDWTQVTNRVAAGLRAGFGGA